MMEQLNTMDTLKMLKETDLYKVNKKRFNKAMKFTIKAPFVILKFLFIFIIGMFTVSAAASTAAGYHANRPRHKRRNTQTVVIRKAGFFEDTIW